MCASPLQARCEAEQQALELQSAQSMQSAQTDAMSVMEVEAQLEGMRHEVERVLALLAEVQRGEVRARAGLNQRGVEGGGAGVTPRRWTCEGVWEGA